MSESVILIVGDRTFIVDRELLVNNSDYFNVLLSGPYRESRDQAIKLSEVDPDEFQELLRFIQGLPVQSSVGLIQLMTMYQVKHDDLELLSHLEIPAGDFVEVVKALQYIYGVLSQKHLDILGTKIKNYIDLSSLDAVIEKRITNGSGLSILWRREDR